MNPYWATIADALVELLENGGKLPEVVNIWIPGDQMDALLGAGLRSVRFGGMIPVTSRAVAVRQVFDGHEHTVNIFRDDPMGHG